MRDGGPFILEWMATMAHWIAQECIPAYIYTVYIWFTCKPNRTLYAFMIWSIAVAGTDLFIHNSVVAPPPPFPASRFSGGITFSTTSSAKSCKVYESYSYGWNILNFLSISIHPRKGEKKKKPEHQCILLFTKTKLQKKRFLRTLVDEANPIRKSPSGCLAPAKTNFSSATKLVSSVWCWIASVQIQYCEWIGHQLPWTSIIPNLAIANTSSLRQQTPNTNFDPNSFAFLECGGTLCGHYPCTM